MDVGFIGLGMMGSPMAANLAGGGFGVTAWNRSPVDQAPPGVQLGDSPAALARHSPTVVVMVSDAAAAREVLLGAGGWAEAAEPSGLVVQMSTIGPEATRELAAALGERGLRLVDAPVGGSVGPAREAKLMVLAGADKADLDEAKPLLEAMAARILHLGPVGAGSAMKLVMNAVLISGVVAGAEALHWLLRDQPGIDLTTAASALERVAPLLAGRVEQVVGTPPEEGFLIDHVLKDMRLIDESLDLDGVLRCVRQAAKDAVDRGFGGMDIAALGAYVRSRM